MKAIKTYIAKTNHILGYTIAEAEKNQQMKYISLINVFIIPLIENLELGDKMPEQLKPIYGRKVVDLSYMFGNEPTTLILYFTGPADTLNNIVVNSQDKRSYRELIDGIGDKENFQKEVEGYYSFMEK